MPNPLPSATALARLCALLQTDLPAKPTLADFQQWKPLAEAVARSQSVAAADVAQLLVEVAAAADDSRCLPFALWSAANVYYRLGDFAQAHAAFQRAADLYTTQNEPLNIARMSVAWVHALGELQRYDDAFTCAQQAEALLTASRDPTDQERLIGLYNTVGIIYEETGQLSNALVHYEKSHHYYAALPKLTHNQLLNFVCVLQSVGIVHTLLGQYLTADRTFTHALTLMEAQLAHGDVRAEYTRTLMDRAWLLTIQQAAPMRVRAAFQAARQSRALLDTTSAARNFALIDLDEANWLLHIGNANAVDEAQLHALIAETAAAGMRFEAVYTKLLLGRLALHQAHYRAAQQIFAEIIETIDDSNPALTYLAQRWYARALRALKQDNAAKAALQKAIHHVEATRRHLKTDDYRAGYLDDKLVAYQDLISLHIDLAEYEAAFQVSEQAKARTLAEAMGSRQFARGQRQSNAGEPIPTVAQIAAQLTRDQVAISYATITDKLYAFLISNHGFVTEPIVLAQLPARSRLENDLHTLQQIGTISSCVEIVAAQEIAKAQTVLAQWFRDYLVLLLPWIQQYTHLIIAPDGLLNLLPFGALYDAATGQYLTEMHEITLIPSVTTWYRIPARVTGYAKTVVVGNSRIDGIAGRLPHTQQEATHVATSFPGATLLLEDDATYANVIIAAPQADLIYIAAHGEYTTGDPSASFIELADRPLRVVDILPLTLNAATVILSACETNKGHLRGNEMMGLVRAFLYAGAHTVLATQWPIEDAATYQVMTHLIQALRNGKPLAAALQAAQGAMLQGNQLRYRHPFFWGSQQVIGRDR